MNVYETLEELSTQCFKELEDLREKFIKEISNPNKDIANAIRWRGGRIIELETAYYLYKKLLVELSLQNEEQMLDCLNSKFNFMVEEFWEGDWEVGATDPMHRSVHICQNRGQKAFFRDLRIVRFKFAE